MTCDAVPGGAERAIARARPASVSSGAKCPGSTSFPAPRTARARRVCSGVLMHGTVPAVRSAAGRSIFGPRAASTTRPAGTPAAVNVST
ncbi:MAG: hypothetical protein QOI78_9413 [Actinomycetota bacterium]|nr:hypothetical protein [Actinomycetota bacterium]